MSQDTKTGKIVSNESGDISEMLNSEFDEHAKSVPVSDYYPPHLRSEIDAISDWLGPELNMGVYRTGFATTQVRGFRKQMACFEAVKAFNCVKSCLIEFRVCENQSVVLKGFKMNQDPDSFQRSGGFINIPAAGIRKGRAVGDPAVDICRGQIMAFVPSTAVIKALFL